MLPRVEVVNEGRKRTLAARWREVVTDPDIRKAEDPRAAALDWFDWFFGHAARPPFLTGRAKDWRADFDFLLTPSSSPRWSRAATTRSTHEPGRNPQAPRGKPEADTRSACSAPHGCPMRWERQPQPGLQHHAWAPTREWPSITERLQLFGPWRLETPPGTSPTVRDMKTRLKATSGNIA